MTTIGCTLSALSPFRSTLFLRITTILVIALIAGLTGRQPAQSAPGTYSPEPLTFKFTGNHEIHYVVGVPDAGGVGTYSVELYRNEVFMTSLTLVGTYSFCDGGLPLDETFDYTVDIYWHDNGQKIYSGSSSFTTTTGLVEGTPLCDVYVGADEDFDIVGRVRLDEATLFIPAGVVVNNLSSILPDDDTGLIHVTAGGRLDIRGGDPAWSKATFNNVSIGQSADGGLFIKNAIFNGGRFTSDLPIPIGTTYFYGNTFNGIHSIYKFGIGSGGLVFENNRGKTNITSICKGKSTTIPSITTYLLTPLSATSMRIGWIAARIAPTPGTSARPPARISSQARTWAGITTFNCTCSTTATGTPKLQWAI